MINKAVFSYLSSTDDVISEALHWLNPRFHLYAWVASTKRARQWYPKMELICDSKAKELFIDILGLPFDTVRTEEFDNFNYDKNFWALGKIKAYQMQDEPFIHIDNDCILHHPLSVKFMESQIITQNPEDHAWFDSAYQKLVDKITKGAQYLPPSWKKAKYAACMGIYGTNNMEFNQQYCKEVFELIDNNTKFWDTIEDKGNYCILFEQHMIANVANNMRVPMTYLSNPFDQKTFEKLGYIHIWGGKKLDIWYQKIKSVVEKHYPREYEIINNLIPNDIPSSKEIIKN